MILAGLLDIWIKNKARDALGHANELFKDDVAGSNLKLAVLRFMNHMKKNHEYPNALKPCIITLIYKQKGSNMKSTESVRYLGYIVSASGAMRPCVNDRRNKGLGKMAKNTGILSELLKSTRIEVGMKLRDAKLHNGFYLVVRPGPM